MTTFQGPIQKESIGPTYSVGIGYDAGDGTVSMYGYNLTPGSDFTESTDLQDESHIVTISSPNSTDRYSRYPKASQGDWEGGGGQLIFTQANQFYQSDGWETAVAGLLLPANSGNTISTAIGTPSTTPSWPATTDGSKWVMGHYDSGASKNAFLGSTGTPLGAAVSIGNANNPEIYNLLRTPDGIFAATSAGIYLVNTATPNSSTLWTADVVQNQNYSSMAYFSATSGASGGVGTLYYILASDGNIYAKGAAGAGAGTITITHPGMEQPFVAICDTAAGLFFATGSSEQGAVDPSYEAILYTFNGTLPANRVDSINGYIKAAVTLNNVTYILAVLDQAAGGGNFTLFSLSGSAITVVADTRYNAPDFQENTVILPLSKFFKPGLQEDGRYLYIGWQGTHGLRYDPVLNAWSYVGAPAPLDTNQDSRVILNTAASGIVDVYGNKTKNVFQAYAFNGAPTTGTFETSYFDFGTPTINKVFSSIAIEMTAVQVAESLTVNFKTDTATTWSPAIVLDSGNGNWIQAVMPVDTIGARIKFQFTYVGALFNNSFPWQIVDYSVTARLGRIWSMTLACRSNPQTISGGDDPQGQTGLQLWANLYNVRKVGGGYMYLWVTDPTDPDGDGSYVAETLHAHIEDMQTTSSKGVPAGARTTSYSGFDAERDITVQIVEDL
jgi:hypothetical protein